MICRICFWLVLLSGFCVAQQVGLVSTNLLNRQFKTQQSFVIEISCADSAFAGQIDTIPQLNFSYGKRTSSIKSDLFRSVIGSAIGGIVGVGIGGFMPVFLNGEYNNRDFPNDAFYLRSYVSASVLATLSSAAALQLSKRREIPYWKLASYSLIPPMILVMPLSAYASVNSHRRELVKSVWVASFISIGVSTLWNVLVYRMHPFRENRMTLRFGQPYLGRFLNSQYGFDGGLTAGVKVIEVHF